MTLAYSLVRTAQPSEFVSLDEAKQHLGVSHNQRDKYISGLIVAARETLEERSNRAFAAQSWRYTVNFWQDIYQLPRPPLVSITSFQYQDENTDWQDVPADVYEIDVDAHPGLLFKTTGKDWPNKRAGLRTVKIEYAAGGYTEQQAVEFVLLTIGHWWENRESVQIGAYNEVPQSASMLLQQLRVGCYP